MKELVFKIGGVVFLMLMTLGCQKVIEVKIGPVPKKYVIEGTVGDNSDSYSVIISQTMNVFDSNIFNGVENAVVSIREEGKAPIFLQSKGNGLYRANAKGIPGRTYHLKINISGEEFTASSQMPPRVAMDSLFVSQRVFLSRVRKIATVTFRDPPGLGNAYRFIQYVDGRKENTIFVTNDHLIDGRSVIYELLIFTDDKDAELKTDDQLRVEMRCINMENYNFWYSLTQSALGQSQSASPGNPISNIKGGALGYFSANTFQEMHIRVD